MAEQHSERNQPDDEPAPLAGPPRRDGEDSPVEGNDLSDNAPTIITRPANRPAPRPEDGFLVDLRGRPLAHFELIEAIGVGGMAAVIRARDTQLDRPVALKILPPEMAADPENVRRFHQEARAAAKLDHENIARVYFCGEDQGLHFIAFEFVEGENLRTLLDRRGRIPVAEAVHYILQVATGLAHSSGRGVIHRDIKPSNIIISGNGRAKLVDMGLARSLEPHTDHGLTQSGVTLGTFDYISPEQALEPREADVRSDIYSLGCTLYHMLTGRPPVPEGTAAKKLHHHQHVAPVDPRQLNPEIPDEVAAVLARMMVKDARHRYQRAEHLVQHLIQLAHKLGTGPDLPESVLFVDTPLPSPPRLRPLVVTVAALFILVALVVLHGMAPWATSFPGPSASATKDRTPEPGRKTGPAVPPAANSSAAAESVLPPVPPQGSDPKLVATAQELGSALRQKDLVREIRLTNSLDLTQEALDGSAAKVQGLVVHVPKRSLTIQPKDDTGLQTILLRYHADLGYEGPDSNVRTALTIKGGHVTLRRLRFEVDATQARVMMAAVRLEDGATVTFDQCEFVQTDAPRTEMPVGDFADSGWLSSVVVDNGRADFQSCCFLSLDRDGQTVGTVDNQNAVTLGGGATVKALHCAFGPHTFLFLLRADDKGNPAEEADLTLDHCSALLAGERASVFKVNEGVTARVVCQDSLFSCPESGPGSGHPANLIQQAGVGRLRYDGTGNRYHHLGKFWVRQNDSSPEATNVAAGWRDFQNVLENNKQGNDQTARVLAISPWAEKDPVSLLKKGEPEKAFLLDVNQPELRQDSSPREHLVGAERSFWGASYTSGLPNLEDKKPATVAKVVDPAVEEIGKGYFKTLGQALEDVKPGDEIQIKANGLLPIKPVRLEKATDDLTIKPFEGYHPVLTLGETSDRDATLFRVRDGRLKLERMEFYLHPSSDEFTTQAVVDLTGNGHCDFQDCVATLEDSRGKPFALVLLTDPSRFMKMDTAAQPQDPQVLLKRCFVRGQGDLLAVRAARPLNVEVENSLVALAGSCVNVEGSSRTPPGAAEIKVSLNQVTAFLGDHLVRLRAGKDGEEPVPVRINTVLNCLFASAEKRALIHLDGMELTTEQMEHLFKWRNGRHNAYYRFQALLDQQPRGDEMPPAPYDQQSWKKFTGEMDAAFPPLVRFAEPPAPDTLVQNLVKAMPSYFKVEKMDTNQTGFGAEVDQLPKPFLDAVVK